MSDPSCCSECVKLRDDFNKIIHVVSCMDQKFDELFERIQVLEEIIDESHLAESDEDEDEKKPNDDCRRLATSPIHILGELDSDEDCKSPASTALEWKDYSQSVEKLFKVDPPKNGVKYTHIEHDTFLKSGYDQRVGFCWLNFKNDEGASWWEVGHRRSG